jgi:hypothetical protein
LARFKHPGQHEQQIAEPVQVLARLGAHGLGSAERDDRPLGARSDRAADMRERALRRARPAG